MKNYSRYIISILVIVLLVIGGIEYYLARQAEKDQDRARQEMIDRELRRRFR